MFFFFFKQKTAYEMRISDWSSDVCSSDLGQYEHMFTRDRATGEVTHIDLTHIMIVPLAPDANVITDPAIGMMAANPKYPATSNFMDARAQEFELGRASGRESVCQYV